MNLKEYMDNYSHFVEVVLSDVSRDDDLLLIHLKDLSLKLNGNCARLDNAVNGLSGETGEIADIWKKIKYHGMEYNEEVRDMFIKELGDVCWYVFLAARALDVPVEEIINRNIDKLRKRHPHGYSAAYIQQKKGE